MIIEEKRIIKWINNEKQKIMEEKLNKLNDEYKNIQENIKELIKYSKDKNIFNIITYNLINKNSNGHYTKAIEGFINGIQNNKDKIDFINKGLKIEDVDTCLIFVKIISNLDNNEDKVKLIKKALEDKNETVRLEATKLIQYLDNDKDKSELIVYLLKNNKGYSVSREAVMQVKFLTNENNQFKLLNECVKNEDINISKTAVYESVNLINKKDMVKILDKGLDHIYEETAMSTMNLIHYLNDENDKKNLIDKALKK